MVLDIRKLVHNWPRPDVAAEAKKQLRVVPGGSLTSGGMTLY